MKKYFLLLILLPFLISCGGSRKVSQTHSRNTVLASTTFNEPSSNSITSSSKGSVLERVVQNAKTFEGTRYKFGGTTKTGMDCSGLVYRAFKQEDILMPRISRDMAQKGVQVRLAEAIEGDLIFFRTGKRNVINHVGLIVETNRGEIWFIHSTTSQGVIISSMKESYWKKAFVEVRRII